MDGTTDINDVANVKIYYTGSDSMFAATNQFGTSATAATGILTMNGTQTLVPGINYFWVAYDLKSTAKLGNFIDAKGLSVKLDSNVKIPTVTNPAGSRIIAKQYCAAGADATDLEYISNVAVGSINHKSGRGTGGYEDLYSLQTNMKMTEIDTVTVSIEEPNSSDELLIWVDWNNNGDFNDAGEDVYSSGTSSQVNYVFVADFAPPVTAVVGATRMRIRLNNVDLAGNNTPCGVSGYGEVEDYSINVTSNAGIGSLSNTKKIVLYPNPVLNQLNVEIQGATETTSLEILNSIGHTVYKSNFVKKTVVDMTKFSVGFYLIKFETGEGMMYRKFVKE